MAKPAMCHELTSSPGSPSNPGEPVGPFIPGMPCTRKYSCMLTLYEYIIHCILRIIIQ